MGRNWTVENKYCKKHPSHKQSKGVCPSCLREKLNQLSASSSASTATNSISSTCSTLSPYSSNLGSSPHEMAMARAKSFSLGTLLRGSQRNINPLKKSRSLAFVVVEEEEEERRKKKRGRGFWAKLLGERRKEEDHKFRYSNTVKERTSSANLVLI